MAIDQVTARSLELVANLSERSRDTLLGVLDRTGTPMGKRVLRMAILQPATDEETIRARLEAVDELTTNEGTFTAIQTCEQLLGRATIRFRANSPTCLSVQPSNPSSTWTT